MRPYGAADDDNNRDATQDGGTAEDSSVVVYRPYTPDQPQASSWDASTGERVEPVFTAEPETLSSSTMETMPNPLLEDEPIATDVDAGRDLAQDTGGDAWIARVPINPVMPPLPVAPVVPVTHEAPVTSVAQYVRDDDASMAADTDASGADDANIPDDPEALRAGIEQTRAEMSDTINAIQEN